MKDLSRFAELACCHYCYCFSKGKRTHYIQELRFEMKLDSTFDIGPCKRKADELDKDDDDDDADDDEKDDSDAHVTKKARTESKTDEKKFKWKWHYIVQIRNDNKTVPVTRLINLQDSSIVDVIQTDEEMVSELKNGVDLMNPILRVLCRATRW